MKFMISFGIGLLITLSVGANARLPDPSARGRELKVLRGADYGALSSAITNFNEVPPEDRAKSPAAARALTQIRGALRKLALAPGQFPIDAKMNDQDLAKGLKAIRVADAFCRMPVVSYFIVHPTTGLKIQPHYSYDSAPTLDEVRALNPDCEVSPVYFSSSPGAAR